MVFCSEKKGEAAPSKVTFSLSQALSGINRTAITLMIRGHTHAALSGSLVPYRSYFLRFILRVLQCYFLHRKTVAVFCEAAGISPSILYEWKKLFLRQKSLWLGMLSDMEESAASFLEGFSGKLLMDFHGTFLFSFLRLVRRVNRDATIHLEGTVYDAPMQFIGQKVVVRFLPGEETGAYILYDGSIIPYG